MLLALTVDPCSSFSFYLPTRGGNSCNSIRNGTSSVFFGPLQTISANPTLPDKGCSTQLKPGIREITIRFNLCGESQRHVNHLRNQIRGIPVRGHRLLRRIAKTFSSIRTFVRLG